MYLVLSHLLISRRLYLLIFPSGRISCCIVTACIVLMRSRGVGFRLLDAVEAASLPAALLFSYSYSTCCLQTTTTAIA